MPTANVLGLSLGESFVEYSLLEGKTVLAQKRAYLPRESLKSSLLAFLNAQTELNLVEAYISLRVPQKMFNYQLTGPVGIVTTAGFENWPSLSKNSKGAGTSKDFIFSVNERMAADGTIVTPLDLTQLEPIAEKLETLKCKKISLQFLHAGTNPAHQNTARDFFVNKGFEVSCANTTDTPNESVRWNTCTMNSVAGAVFTDIKKDLLEVLTTKIAEDKISFVNSAGKLESSTETQALSSQLSGIAALAETSAHETDLLYLGLEGFYLIHPQEYLTTWQSPWGDLGVSHVKFQNLQTQPTSRIDLNTFGHFDFTNEIMGWEPGPMMLGRGQRPTLLDLWSDNSKLTQLETFTDRVVSTGQQRFKNSLLALSNVNRLNASDLGGITKNLQSLAIQRIVMEALLKKRHKKLKIVGPLSGLFANGFKKDSSASLDTQEYCEAQAIALWGQKLKGRLS